MKTKLFTLLLAVVASLGTMFASDTQVGGIWYDFDSTSKTATVTFQGSNGSDDSYEYTGSVVIPASVVYNSETYSVTSIGDAAFGECSSLTSVTIPNSVTSIGNSAFAVCTGLTSVNIPNSVTTIGYYAFYGCSGLTSVTIPNSVTSIEMGTFSSCGGLTTVTVGNSVTGIGENAFYNCSSLTFVTFGNSVTSIGNHAFEGCSGLTTVTIPNSVTSIGDYAFYQCSGLKSVTIGNSVTSIGEYAFAVCSSLTSLLCFAATPPQLSGSFVFYLVDCPLYVPFGSINNYKTVDKWKDFTNILPISAKEKETNSVQTSPTNYSVDIVWPQVSGAATYELVIQNKDGNVFNTLVFNNNGQLQSTAFNVPARNNAPQQAQSTVFSFTVTGLESGTSYDLTITSKDNNGDTLDTKTCSFTTTDTATSVEEVLSDQVQCTKVIRNGQIYILRGEKVYTLTGQEVK